MIDLSKYASDTMKIHFHVYDSYVLGLSYYWTVDNIKATGQTIGISCVAVSEAGAGRVYNLNGQLVSRSNQGLSCGVYIIGGKKVIIR